MLFFLWEGNLYTPLSFSVKTQHWQYNDNPFIFLSFSMAVLALFSFSAEASNSSRVHSSFSLTLGRCCTLSSTVRRFSTDLWRSYLSVICFFSLLSLLVFSCSIFCMFISSFWMSFFMSPVSCSSVVGCLDPLLLNGAQSSLSLSQLSLHRGPLNAGHQKEKLCYWEIYV